jgi:hypothetical protein
MVRTMLTHHIVWADYYYVGGYYGNLSAQMLQLELMRGPIVVGIDAHYDLLHYQVSERI